MANSVRLRLRYPFSFVFTLISLGGISQIKIADVPTCQTRQFSLSDFEQIMASVEGYRGQSKLTSLDPISFGKENWHPGSWGRGFFSVHYSQRNFHTYVHGIFSPDSSLRFWGCHPLIRYTGRMVRAHIHARRLYPSIQNNGIIREGISFLIKEQQENGSFPYYKYRAGSSVMDPMKSNEIGEEEYETSEGLRAMAESYLYLQGQESDFQKDSLYSAIILAADWLATRFNQWQTWNNNSNIPGLTAWALTAAAKVENKPIYRAAISNICKMLISRQQKAGSNSGLWLTGGTELIANDPVIHDSKIWYHAIIVRGLVEALDATDGEDNAYKEQLTNAIKLAINHVIMNRIRANIPSIKAYPGPATAYCIGGDAFIEMVSLLAYKSIFHAEFSLEDRKNLQNLLDQVSINLTNEIENFTFLQNYNSMAYYAYYSNAIKAKGN